MDEGTTQELLARYEDGAQQWGDRMLASPSIMDTVLGVVPENPADAAPAV